MAPITPPARSIPTRRPQRQSISISGADDISHLNLAQVRDRLARNERVLNSGLFSSNPTTGFVSPPPRPPQTQSPYTLSSSPQASVGFAGGIPTTAQANGTEPSSATTSTSASIANTTTPGGGSMSAASSPSGDSVRDKLLAVRAQLKAREAELLLETATSGMGHMDVGDSGGGGGGGTNGAGVPVPVQGGKANGSVLASSPTAFTGMVGRRTSATNGKQRALDFIRQQEEQRPNNGIMLPIAQSIALGDRDFENKTAAELAALTLDGPSTSSSKPLTSSTSSQRSLGQRTRRRPRPAQRGAHEDEISRAEQSARINALYTRRTRTGGSAAGGGTGGADFDEYDSDGDLDWNEYGDGDGVSGDIFNDEGYDGREEREYDGTGMPLDPDREGEAATGEMDEDEMDGEDNEHFSEGNEDYSLTGTESAAVGSQVAMGR